MLTFYDVDWCWLVENAKLQGRQNRLGFIVLLAAELAQSKNDCEHASTLAASCIYLHILQTFRLSEEDTLCHDSMTEAERAWVREHRTSAAAHWNLLTDMKAEQVPYAGSCSAS